MGVHLQRNENDWGHYLDKWDMQVRPCGEDGGGSSRIFCIIASIIHFALLVELSRNWLRMFTALFVEEFRNLEMKGADIFIIVM